MNNENNENNVNDGTIEFLNFLIIYIGTSAHWHIGTSAHWHISLIYYYTDSSQTAPQTGRKF